MDKIQTFTDLTAWQQGHTLVILTYKMTESFPSEEKFSLTSQIRRSTVSVTSNLAEGFGRQGQNDKLHFYTMARGSLLELQNQLLVARDIRLLTKSDFDKLAEQSIQVHKLINGLIRSIRRAK